MVRYVYVFRSGPWVVWQIICWGAMGLVSGTLKEPLKASGIFRSTYGFIWGFIFGWVMNLWYMIGYMDKITLGSIALSCVASFYFDLMHALSNALLLSVAGSFFIRSLARIAAKYNL